jgi:hypothetical protein
MGKQWADDWHGILLEATWARQFYLKMSIMADYEKRLEIFFRFKNSMNIIASVLIDSHEFLLVLGGPGFDNWSPTVRIRKCLFFSGF